MRLDRSIWLLFTLILASVRLPAAEPIRIALIGDSTVASYAKPPEDRPDLTGWGQVLGELFQEHVKVSNHAASGRSSKSFYDEGAWTPIRTALRAGDMVLIQFGHNDEKADDATRYTEPFTTFEQYLSIYIDDAIAKGATPILITPINRNNWSNGTVRDTHGNYPVAMRQLAGQTDLTGRRDGADQGHL